MAVTVRFCRFGQMGGALFTALLIGGLVGCVSVPQTTPSETAVPRPHAPSGFPVHIAVIPLNNASSDAEGPVLVRAFAVRKLARELGYIVLQTDETDHELASRNLIWSGQPVGRELLSKQDPALLASWLGVDGILHGELTAYSSETISIYTEKKVHVHFWLTDATGKKVWESQKGDADGGGFGGGSSSMDNLLQDGSLSADVQARVRRSALAGTALNAVDAAFANFPFRS